MPFFTDTHVHFDASSAATAASVQRALAANVTRLLAVGGSAELNAAALAAARAFPQQVRLALGWDRDQAGQWESASVRQCVSASVHTAAPSCDSTDARTHRLTDALTHRLTDALPRDLALAAIGEIGLDFHYHPDTRTAQCALFAAMLRLADARDLPVIIHSREADDDTLHVLDTASSKTRRGSGALGVVHCYTGGPDFARALLDRGLYLSFSGILTFRNADMLRGVARLVPADRLLIETDSPFLAPVPRRGERNEPAFVVHVAEQLATLRGVPLETLADLTNQNAERLFGPWPV
ncbi:MAG: TatD family hydrolase [bacterium]